MRLDHLILYFTVIDSFCHQKSLFIEFSRLGIRGYKDGKIQSFPLRLFLIPETDDSIQIVV